MAANQGKHSLSGAQGSRRRAYAPTKPAPTPQKRKLRPSNSSQASSRPRAKTGNIKVRPRRSGRNFYRFKDARGKPLDFIEFFTSSDYHCIDVRFQDKTAFHFIIDPAFIVEADFSDWKTGNWRPIKRWRPIRSDLSLR